MLIFTCFFHLFISSLYEKLCCQFNNGKFMEKIMEFF